MKVKLVLIIGVLLGILIYSIWSIGAFVSRGISANRRAMHNDLPSTIVLHAEDSTLLCKTLVDNIKVLDVWNSKLRSPVSFVNYKGEYAIVIHHLDIDSAFSLKEKFRISENPTGLTREISYRKTEGEGITFYFTGATLDSIVGLELLYVGNSLQIPRLTDSLVSLNLFCSKLSIKYSKSGPVDMLVESTRPKSDGKEVPLGLMFYRRLRKLYLFIVISTEQKSLKRPRLPDSVICFR